VLTPLIAIALCAPLYLWLRRPFAKLPLHIDTGYYVSNHTVATGRVDFSKGWNARFAGCCKVVPEFFYSYVFQSCRNTADSSAVADEYKSRFRLLSALFNYATAIAVAALATYCLDGGATTFALGLIVYCLLSSEPQYGVYYECGEWFGLLPQICGSLLLIVGLDTSNATLLAAASFVLVADAVFIKLSSTISAAIMLAVTVAMATWSILPLAAGGLVACGAYTLWIVHNGQNPMAMFDALRGHETSYGQRPSLSTIVNRLREKADTIARSFIRHPVIPAMMLVGLVLAPPAHPIFWAYLVGGVCAYVLQAANCWYYQIPLLPIIAILATGGVRYVLTTTHATGWIIAAAAVVIASIAVFRGLRARRMTLTDLTKRSWNHNQPDDVLDADIALERFARQSPEIHNHTLLTYGPFSQSYVLLGASYPTPIITPDLHMNDMCTHWQATLSRQLIDNPPDFILDTRLCFHAATTRRELGLDYKLRRIAGASIQLYEFVGRSIPSRPPEDVRTFQPVSTTQLQHELSLAGDALRDETSTTASEFAPSISFAPETNLAPPVESDTDRLRSLLRTIVKLGYQRIAIYGAGRFTFRHAGVYRDAPLDIVAILDDRADLQGKSFVDWQVCSPESAPQLDLDAVVISTDRFTAAMRKRARDICGTDVAVLTVSDDPLTIATSSRSYDPSCEQSLKSSPEASVR
jgi:hypothetical protein